MSYVDHLRNELAEGEKRLTRRRHRRAQLLVAMFVAAMGVGAVVSLTAADTTRPVETAASSDPPTPSPNSTGEIESTGEVGEPSVAPTSSTGSPGSKTDPSPAQWRALRECESMGRYDAVSPGGTYHGAYQLTQTIWDDAAAVAQPDLIGVLPSSVGASLQNAIAEEVFGQRGLSAWPICGEFLRPQSHDAKWPEALTTQELMVMASIIEVEAERSGDRERVARVLHERLRDDVPLGINSPLLFVLGKSVDQLTSEDLELDSPFNTRVIAGLPPEPIGAISAEALHAALNPAEGDWYFYLTGNDGAMSFFNTEEEFRAAVSDCRDVGRCFGDR